MLALKLPVSIN